MKGKTLQRSILLAALLLLLACAVALTGAYGRLRAYALAAAPNGGSYAYDEYFEFPLDASGGKRTTDGIEVQGDISEARAQQDGVERGLYFGGYGSKIMLDQTEAYQSLKGAQKVPSTFTVDMEVNLPDYGDDHMTLFFWAGYGYNEFEPKEDDRGVNGVGMYVTADGSVRVSFRKLTQLSGDTVPLNTWTHIRLEYTGTGNGEADFLHLYIDEKEQTNMHFEAATVSSNFHKYAPHIGITLNDSRPFTGYIDNFSLKVDELPEVVLSMDRILGTVGATNDAIGNATATATGVYASGVGGYYFDGESSKVEISNPEYAQGEGFVLELSAYLESYGSGDMALLSWGSTGANSVDGLMLAVASDGKIKVAYNAEEAVTAAGAMPLNAWTTVRLAYVNDASDYFALYVGGSEVAFAQSLKAGETLHANLETAKIWLGRISGTDAKAFVGHIKDVRYETIFVKYTVTFDSQGGSAVASSTVKSGGKVLKPITNPTRAGYTFAGWFTAAENGEEWNFTSGIVTGNLTLYAHWTANTPSQPEPGTGTEPGTGDDPGPGPDAGTTTTPPAEKKGCGSAVAGTSAILAMLLLALSGSIVLKKKGAAK